VNIRCEACCRRIYARRVQKMTAVDEETLWSRRVLGTAHGNACESVRPSDVPGVLSYPSAVALAEENQDLHRILRGLVHSDVSRALRSDAEDVPLAMHAELQLYDMRKRLKRGGIYVRANCLGATQHVECHLTKTADLAKRNFIQWQDDVRFVQKFEWAKCKFDKDKQIRTLSSLARKLEGKVKQHQTTQQELINGRKQITRKISKQQKEQLRWKNSRENLHRHLSVLEHCYEYISNASYQLITENTAESYVASIIKGMRITVAELMRQNRELELKAKP